MNERLRAIGLGALAPAPLVFAAREVAKLTGGDLPWPFFAIVGILSAIGMAMLCVVLWSSADRYKMLVATVVALLGHYVIADLVDADLGAAMVYLGTGFAISLAVSWTAYAGMAAGTGAILRKETAQLGAALLIVGGLGLAIGAILGARTAWRGHNPDNPDAD